MQLHEPPSKNARLESGQVRDDVGQLRQWSTLRGQNTISGRRRRRRSNPTPGQAGPPAVRRATVGRPMPRAETALLRLPGFSRFACSTLLSTIAFAGEQVVLGWLDPRADQLAARGGPRPGAADGAHAPRRPPGRGALPTGVTASACFGCPAAGWGARPAPCLGVPSRSPGVVALWRGPGGHAFGLGLRPHPLPDGPRRPTPTTWWVPARLVRGDGPCSGSRCGSAGWPARSSPVALTARPGPRRGLPRPRRGFLAGQPRVRPATPAAGGPRGRDGPRVGVAGSVRTSSGRCAADRLLPGAHRPDGGRRGARLLPPGRLAEPGSGRPPGGRRTGWG